VRILLVGGGGREHALAWALARSSSVDALLAAPGNPGIAETAALVPVGADDVPTLTDLARRERIDLVVVGPEAPLVEGLADGLRAAGVAVFGPSRAGARLEGSKAWARALCKGYGIAAPRSRTFTALEPALEYLDRIPGPPFVVKADGLAAGKGVTVAADAAEADRALRASLGDRAFGEAGRTVVVEEFLEGEEVSALALTDGRTVLPLALAQDFKRAHDGDRGPNTGGMGAYSPLPFVDAAGTAPIEDLLVRTVNALNTEDVAYSGVLYAGLMLTSDGPKVLEFNCRFGDPETQVVLPRFVGDLAEALLATAEGRLSEADVRWRRESCVGVVLASAGYPGLYESGFPIGGLREAARLEGVQVFHAGTRKRDSTVVTAGGRVLTVSALGSDVEHARARAYEACSLIRFEGMTYRRDIAAARVTGRT
jgi:phosphoribosylamine--glycine ligase